MGGGRVGGGGRGGRRGGGGRRGVRGGITVWESQSRNWRASIKKSTPPPCSHKHRGQPGSSVTEHPAQARRETQGVQIYTEKAPLLRRLDVSSGEWWRCSERRKVGQSAGSSEFLYSGLLRSSVRSCSGFEAGRVRKIKYDLLCPRELNEGIYVCVCVCACTTVMAAGVQQCIVVDWTVSW